MLAPVPPVSGSSPPPSPGWRQRREYRPESLFVAPGGKTPGAEIRGVVGATLATRRRVAWAEDAPAGARTQGGSP